MIKELQSSIYSAGFEAAPSEDEHVFWLLTHCFLTDHAAVWVQDPRYSALGLIRFGANAWNSLKVELCERVFLGKLQMWNVHADTKATKIHQAGFLRFSFSFSFCSLWAFLAWSNALGESGCVWNTYESNNCSEKCLFQAPWQDVLLWVWLLNVCRVCHFTHGGAEKVRKVNCYV